MKKNLPLIFALSISTGSVLALNCAGDGDCTYPKGESSQEMTEAVEESGK